MDRYNADNNVFLCKKSFRWNIYKMLIVFYLLMIVGVGRTKDGSALETKTAALGDDVSLTCPRNKTEVFAKLFWIRFIPGKWPEILGATHAFDFKDTNEQTTHIKAQQGKGTFFLYISKVEESDAGLYYCVKVDFLYLTFLKGEFLRIKGKESNINAIIQHPFPDVLRPGDSVSLQCSVLFNSQDKTCPTDDMVYWFQTGSDTIYPSFVYAQGNHGDECENSPEDHSERKCFYSLSKNISASDFGTFYCAVASCGEIMFGNGTKLDIQEPNIWNLQKTNAVFILLCVALAASVVLIFFLTYNLRKKTCHCSNGAVGGHGDRQNQQVEEVSMVYTTPTFNRRKASRNERKHDKTPEAVYTDVSELRTVK